MKTSLPEGRKYSLCLFGMCLIPLLVILKADSTAFGAVTLIVGAFVGGNAVVESKHAGAKDE